ncbi:MAG TPA: iron ABC transporter permease [Acidimicrobiia bacterium]|nr:iron ABC transporter permease [Acidimicrobiia bacterium]
MLAVPIAFLGVFFVYPVASIVGRGLTPDGSLDLSPLGDVVTAARFRGVAWFTIWQATVSTALTVLVALPGAYVFARYEFRGKRLVRAAVLVPFVLPTVVVGSAFLAVLGDGGPLGFLGFDQSLAAILVAHVFFNYAVVVLIVGGLWAHLDPRQEDAARVLGAGRWQTFRSVTLPSLRPAIAAAAAIVFLFDFTSFGVILILGGPGYSTLETEIYRQTVQFLDLPQAAALSIVQMAAVVVVLLVAGRAQGRRAEALRLRAVAETSRRPRTAGDRAVVGINLAVMAILLGGPIAVLFERSFDTAGGYGLGFYRALSELRRTSTIFVPPVEAVRNSLVFAAAATVIALVIGGLAAFAIAGPGRSTRSAGLDTLLLLPLGVSAVTIGFGFLIALDKPPFDLRASPVLIPIAHALVAAPFVARVLIPVLRSIDQRLRDTAAVLGASPGRVWREIDLPIVARALLVAAGFAFAISLGEFGATIFIARPDYPTLPVVIFRLLGQPGTLNFGAAMAASVILMAVTAIAIFAIERFRFADIGEF